MRVYPFPTLKQSFGVKKIIDVRQLMEDWKPLGNPIATYLERPIGSRDVKAARGMQDAFATVRSLLKLLGCHTVYITPQSWQKTYWVKPREAGPEWDTKKIALSIANQRFPDQNFLASKRSYVPHDGMVDAALIADNCRRNHNPRPRL